jgi:hypothetical protein
MAPFADARIVRVVDSTMTRGVSGNFFANGSQTFWYNR